MNNLTTVLFVDDEPMIIRSIQRILHDSPFTVLTAGSAEEALGLLREQTIDVLISDIEMPGMTGIELVKIVRREFPSTMRMLLTGMGTLERTLEAINEGEVQRFFNKPFEVHLFRATMLSLGDRLDKLRRDGELDAQRARRDEFYRWVEEGYPGTLSARRSDEDEVMVAISSVELGLLES